MLNVICAEYRNLFIDMLNVVRLSVIRLNVFMVSVVAPGTHPYNEASQNALFVQAQAILTRKY
jgi:hypothetical protein